MPKLRGFKNDRFRTEYQVVNIGQISAYAEAGRFGVELEQGKPAGRSKSGDAPATINAEVLAQAGLIRGNDKPLKILGQGEVSQKLFVAADAFSASAQRKIEDAGGFVQLLREPEAAPEKLGKRALRKGAGRAAAPADDTVAAPAQDTEAEPKKAKKGNTREGGATEAVTAPVEELAEESAPAEEAGPVEGAAEEEPAAEARAAQAESAPEAEASPSEPAKPARKRTAKKDAEES